MVVQVLKSAPVHRRHAQRRIYVGDLITALDGMPEYQGSTFQKFVNGVLVSPSGDDGTVSPTAPLNEGDILTLTLKTVGGHIGNR